MLKFYYHPLSPLSRRVWITLLEKEIPFDSIIINLKDREQFKPDFLALNPFHHVPVIVDDGLRIIESLAILDYLECKYPRIPLLPEDAAAVAKVRMAQMIANNELSSLVIPLIGETPDSPKFKQTERKITRILDFLADTLQQNAYFGGKNLSLGDIVAGNSIILVQKLGFDLQYNPKIDRWCDRLMAREVWQKTQPNSQQIGIFKQTIKQLLSNP